MSFTWRSVSSFWNSCFLLCYRYCLTNDLNNPDSPTKLLVVSPASTFSCNVRSIGMPFHSDIWLFVCLKNSLFVCVSLFLCVEKSRLCCACRILLSFFCWWEVYWGQFFFWWNSLYEKWQKKMTHSAKTVLNRVHAVLTNWQRDINFGVQ